MVKKKYRVHRFEVKDENVYVRLKHFLNDLEGEIVSLLPYIKKSSSPQLYGVTAKINFLMVVEKI